MESKYDGRFPEPPYPTESEREEELDRLRTINSELKKVLQHTTIPLDDALQWITALCNPSEYISENDNERALQFVTSAQTSLLQARAAIAKATA